MRMVCLCSDGLTEGMLLSITLHVFACVHVQVTKWTLHFYFMLHYCHSDTHATHFHACIFSCNHGCIQPCKTVCKYTLLWHSVGCACYGQAAIITTHTCTFTGACRIQFSTCVYKLIWSRRYHFSIIVCFWALGASTAASFHATTVKQILRSYFFSPSRLNSMKSCYTWITCYSFV